MSAPKGTQKPPYSMHRTEVYESDVTALAAGAAIITIDFDSDYSHTFAGVTYYDSITGDNVVTPGAGTEAYTVETLVKPEVFQTVTGSPLNSADEADISWNANVTRVRVVLAAVTTATHVRLRVGGNAS
jgi:hypothetical protein